jgi:hypothetical protein
MKSSFSQKSTVISIETWNCFEDIWPNHMLNLTQRFFSFSKLWQFKNYPIMARIMANIFASNFLKFWMMENWSLVLRLTMHTSIPQARSVNRTFVTGQKKLLPTPPVTSSRWKHDWFAKVSFGVISPTLFEDDEGTAVTVALNCYTQMSCSFLCQSWDSTALTYKLCGSSKTGTGWHCKDLWCSVAGVPGTCNVAEWVCSVACKISWLVSLSDYFLLWYLTSRGSFMSVTIGLSLNWSRMSKMKLQQCQWRWHSK